MFNVSALLLDDALKPATPLTWHYVKGLISPATANEPMIDVLFYFITF